MRSQQDSNSTGGATHDIPAVDSSLVVGRRRFVKGAVAGIGVATIGVGIKDQTAADASVSPNSHSHGSLRAITWTEENSAIGVIAAGAKEARLRPMSVQNGRLQSHGDDIAKLSVGPGPIAIGASPSGDGTMLITRTTVESVGQYSVSYDLDANMRQYFSDQGVGLDGYQTAGEYIFDRQQVVPEPILIDSSGTIRTASTLQSIWRDKLVGAHYEPISINFIDNRWMLFMVGSGKYSLESTIFEEIIGLELSDRDASIIDIHSISKIDSHFNIGYKSLEVGESKIAFVSSDTPEEIQVLSYDVGKQTTKVSKHRVSDFPASGRLLQHDRLSSSGRQESWVVEVMPGTYALETMGDETL